MKTKLLMLAVMLNTTYVYSNTNQPQPDSNEVKRPQVQETRIWLQIQRENMMATSYQDTLSPEAAKAAQQRALKTFSHELPDKFIKNSFGEK